MTEKHMGYIQASHTVLWGQLHALLHPIAYGAGKVNVCDSLPIIHALQSWSVCDGAHIINVAPQNSACDGNDNRHEQQGCSVWDRWYIGNSYLTTSVWDRCGHHICLDIQNICIPTPYRIRVLGRVGWTPYCTHSLGDGLKLCHGKGMKTVCIGHRCTSGNRPGLETWWLYLAHISSGGDQAQWPTL
jgi:hypothetical protein